MSHQSWVPDSATWRRWRMDKLPNDDITTPSQSEGSEESTEPTAEERSQRLENERQQALEAGHQQGFERGHGEGLAAGFEQGLAEGRARAESEITEAIERQTAQALEPIRQLVEQFQTALSQLDDAVVEELANLALATGRQLAGEALKTRPRQVVELVNELLHTDPPLVGRQRLWLHPLDLKLVQTHLGESLATAGWSLRVDDRQQRGGCRIVGEHGELDATWQRRWEAARGQVRRRNAASDDDA
ncbi:flagellar assembly protein FliH [Halomonas huangheensis]|uniref:Flagellar assembly protein FliH n=1 Tax=Halomonas huangheensis TaxID=1178482 RepID=W1N774_9GAMM|nr:flagellar assembly protein FliH [Halomonas huangheensis]ALM54234.1 hypothetical protein AR456_19655 [Halomonas huangheensis]ERL50780.1 hypothetical protein BJB45_19485 [Halomonas huangheensis]